MPSNDLINFELEDGTIIECGAAFERCVSKVMKGGKSKSSAHAICTAGFKKAGRSIKEDAPPDPEFVRYLQNKGFNLKLAYKDRWSITEIAGVTTMDGETGHRHDFWGHIIDKFIVGMTNMTSHGDYHFHKIIVEMDDMEISPGGEDKHIHNIDTGTDD